MNMINSGILPFVQAMDAFFPIGAYTLSDGMETYVQQGIVQDKTSLERFLKSYLYILPYTKLGFAAKAALGENYELLDALCSASTSAYEVRKGSKKLCTRFLKAQIRINELPLLQEYTDRIKSGSCDGCFPVAVGVFIRSLAVNVNEALSLYCYNQLSAMVNHAVKLVPLPQLDGQAALAEMLPHIGDAVKSAVECKIDELGISGSGFELRAIQHETLESRMYIS